MANRRLVLVSGILVAIVLYALLVPPLAGIDDRVTDFAAARQPPSTAHVFGTDSAGRDLFVRTAAGIQVSLLIASICALLTTAIGVFAGAVSGLAGGWVDRIVMRLADAISAVPQLMLGIVIVAMYRGNIVAIILSIAVTHWVQVARIVRSEVLSLRSSHFIEAAVTAGASRTHLITAHLVPAVLPQAVVAVVLLLPHAVWHESTLSFLGFGLPPHKPSLGTLLEEARSSLLLGGWWTLAFPALVLVTVTVTIAILGSTLKQLLAPPRPSRLAR